MTQTELILKYLQTGKSLTPLEALNKFQCFRLGARIYDIKQKGINVKSEMAMMENGKYVAKYTLTK